MPGFTVTGALILFLGVACAWLYDYRRRRGLPYPPGPSFLKGQPPTLKIDPKMSESEAQWGWSHAQALKYGNLTHVGFLGVHAMTIDDYATANELLNNRAGNYSSRPKMMMAVELPGHTDSVGLSPYNARWKELRRLLTQSISSGSSKDLSRYIHPSRTRMLRNLVSNGTDFFTHVKLAIASNTLRVGYGIKIESLQNPFVEAGEVCFKDILITGFGQYMVDFFPVLRHLPQWFGFQRKALEMRKHRDTMNNRPIQYVQEKMSSGKPYDPSMASMLISEGQPLDAITAACGSLYTAGTETTRAAVLSFIFAMTMHQDVQQRVYQELEGPLGLGTATPRLPTTDDLELFPYLRAVIKEALRWHVPSYQVLPHATLEDDFYKGMFIPKGSIFQANLWSMSQDEAYYPSPDKFDPSRFTGPEEKRQLDPAAYQFGFGRRTCPAQHFAEKVIFVFACSLVACFRMEKELDAQDREVTPDASCWRVGSTLDFKCRFTPRNERIVKMLQSEEDRAPQ